MELLQRWIRECAYWKLVVMFYVFFGIRIKRVRLWKFVLISKDLLKLMTRRPKKAAWWIHFKKIYFLHNYIYFFSFHFLLLSLHTCFLHSCFPLSLHFSFHFCFSCHLFLSLSLSLSHFPFFLSTSFFSPLFVFPLFSLYFIHPLFLSILTLLSLSINLIKLGWKGN